ncbi:4421_t:CDS:1, partial [Entrophospora sp. SA101]
VKNNKKVLKGYIFFRAYLDQELVRIFYGFSEVTGFLGQPKEINKLPNFVSEEVIASFFNQVPTEEENTLDNNYPATNLAVGDLVRITAGSFTNYEGKIAQIDKNKQKVSINIEFVGKKTLINNIPITSCQKVLT